MKINRICAECMNSCKQPAHIQMITCPRFEKSVQMTLKFTTGKAK